MKRTVKQPEERRRELIAAALNIFCEKGYEQTSIRGILEAVGGEVGMFYHYFKSKDEIFGLAVALFLDNCMLEFTRLADDDETPVQQSIDELIALIDRNIAKYTELWAQKVHWSMAAAIHKSMLERMVPSIERLIGKADAGGALAGPEQENRYEAARFLLYGISGVLHEKPLAETPEAEYKNKLRFVSELASRLLTGGERRGV
jgi:AcrR family transcriptional regulator